MTEIHGNAMQS